MRVIKQIGEWFDHRLQLAAPIREVLRWGIAEPLSPGLPPP